MIKEEQKQALPTAADVTKKVRTGLGNGRGTLILAILGIAVSLASSFMFCLASIGFDFAQLRNTVFYTRWASMVLSTMCAYAFVLVHKDEVNRLTPWYKDKLTKIAEKSETVGDEFETYLKELNEQRAVEWYRRKMNAQIARLNHKLLTAELHNGKTAKIKAKIEKYKACMTDQYIKEHKHVLKTRSKPIRSVQVLSSTKKGDAGEVNFRSESKYYGGKAIFKIASSFVMTAAFACVIVSNFGAGITIASIVMTVLTVLSMFLSVLSAILAANGCYNNVYVPNILFKLKILADFEKWKQKTAESQPLKSSSTP